MMSKHVVDTSFHLNRVFVAVKTGHKQWGKLVLLLVVQDDINMSRTFLSTFCHFLACNTCDGRVQKNKKLAPPGPRFSDRFKQNWDRKMTTWSQFSKKIASRTLSGRSRTQKFFDQNMSVVTSSKMRQTAPPCIVQMQRFLREIQPPPLSLAQGIVYWSPPSEALLQAKVVVFTRTMIP